MANQIFNALGQGFTADQILNFLLKKFPQHVNKIQKASLAGFTPKQIIKFLAKGKKSFSETEEGDTEFEAVRNKKEQQRENINKGALSAAALAATPLAYKGLQAAAPLVQGAIQRALPSTVQPNPSAAAPSSLGTLTTQPQLQPLTQTSVPPNVQSMTPSVTTNPTISQAPILEKHGIKAKVDDLLKGGNDADQASGFFEKFEPKKVKAIEKETGMSLKDIIEGYTKENVATPEKKEQSIEEVPHIEKPEEEPEAKPIAKQETVASPQGIGTVLEMRNGKALIEVDGKKHQVSVDDLIQSPISEKDLADLHDELIRAIEKETGEEVSRNVNWAGYDADLNELAYRPHNGALYRYTNISPERAETLKKFLVKRKTTDKNYIGPWVEGSKSPIGAAMSALIKELQAERGGKGNEYEAKYETIYDAIEPASKAAKEKYARLKKEATQKEKEEKKREKENEKRKAKKKKE